VRRGAHEAIPVLEAPNEIRVLFTDVRMPGSMNGYALAHYVHGRWPEVTIVTSGHTRVREDSLPTGAVFMPKPYDPALLPRCIKEMISSLPPSVGEARGFFADVSRRFVLPEPHVDDVPQEVIGRPRQVSRLRDKLRLDPMNAGKNEWEAEPG
jgi:CheY-like chemotaxis protein